MQALQAFREFRFLGKQRVPDIAVFILDQVKGVFRMFRIQIVAGRFVQEGIIGVFFLIAILKMGFIVLSVEKDDQIFRYAFIVQTDGDGLSLCGIIGIGSRAFRCPFACHSCVPPFVRSERRRKNGCIE